MSEPVSDQLITTLATTIETITPPALFSPQKFRRIRVQDPDGTEAAIAPKSDPSRNRLFDILVETAKMSPNAHSDDTRFVLNYILILRFYYAEMRVAPGHIASAFLEQRVKISDAVALYRAVIEANIFTHNIAGASSVVDAGMVFSPGLIEWRIDVNQEELTI